MPSLHLISLHDSAADATVIPQHASVIEVKTIMREKLGMIERERTMAPKMHVWQTFQKFSEQTVSILYVRIEVRLPIRYEQTRDNATHEHMTHAGYARNTKRKIDNRKHRGFGSRAPVTQVVRPEIEYHGVWGKIPDKIKLRRRGENAAWLLMTDVVHETKNGRFLESKVIPRGIAFDEVI